jgi:hypothetical protein
MKDFASKFILTSIPFFIVAIAASQNISPRRYAQHCAP